MKFERLYFELSEIPTKFSQKSLFILSEILQDLFIRDSVTRFLLIISLN